MSNLSPSLWDQLYPSMVKRAFGFFRYLKSPEDREDCASEVIAMTWQAYCAGPLNERDLWHAFFKARMRARFGEGIAHKESEHDPLSWKHQASDTMAMTPEVESILWRDARRTTVDSRPYVDRARIFALDQLRRPIPALLLDSLGV